MVNLLCKDGVMLTVVASLLIVECSNFCLERGLRVRDGQDYRVRKQVLTPIAFKNPDKFYLASIGTKPDRQFDVASLACPPRLYPICVRSEVLALLGLSDVLQADRSVYSQPGCTTSVIRDVQSE